MIKKKPSEKNITRQEISELVSKSVPDMSAKSVSVLVDSVINTMRETLAKGEDIKISGFGKFTVKSKKSRTGRNPQTGGPVNITARRVLRFKPSNILRDEINSASQ